VIQAAPSLCSSIWPGCWASASATTCAKRLFNHLQRLSLTYYNRMPVGWIISRVTSDTDRVAELVTWGLLDVTWSSFNIITALFFMWQISWQLTLIVMVIVPIIIVVATLFQKRIIVQYREVRKVNSKITGAYNETITGVRVIKALDREEANLREFGKLTGEMYRPAIAPRGTRRSSCRRCR
jgi:ATP-binding cassette subfamily B protein